MYVINLDNKQCKGIDWVSLFIDRNRGMYFESFGTDYIPQEVVNKVNNKSITHSIFRVQFDDPIVCGFYCITFINCMIPGKRLLDCTNLFCSNSHKKKDKIIYKLFKEKMWQAFPLN